MKTKKYYDIEFRDKGKRKWLKLPDFTNMNKSFADGAVLGLGTCGFFVDPEATYRLTCNGEEVSRL